MIVTEGGMGRLLVDRVPGRSTRRSLVRCSKIGAAHQTCQTGAVSGTRRGLSPRRSDPLSRERIVATAIGLLDEAGEAGLTTRALGERLATGPGAIYHRVGSKDELLVAATDTVVAAALRGGDTLHAVAVGLFSAIGEHTWLSTQLATQLARDPWGPVTPMLFESIGRQVRTLGVPEHAWFSATSAVLHYVLGAAALNAVAGAHARTLDPAVDRGAFLDTVATAWEDLDPDTYPFTRTVADQLRHHDDHDEFVAGLDVVLAGLAVVHRPPSADDRP